ncbi:unnamed protein product, partial [Polarella glacialis]
MAGLLAPFSCLLNRLSSSDDGSAGFTCSRAVPKGAPLLALPLSACWTASSARRCSQLEILVTAGSLSTGAAPDLLEADATWLALHLLFQRHLGSQADPVFRAHLALLPAPGSLETLLAWSDEELGALQGSRWQQIAQQCNADIEAEFEELRASLGEEVLGQLGATSDSYFWAQQVLQQCCISFIDGESSPVDVLVPGMNLLVGRESDVPPSPEGARLEFLPGPDASPVVVLYASRYFGEGEQVGISHGGLTCTSGRRLMGCGRLLTPNPWDCVELGMTLPLSAALAPSAAKLAEACSASTCPRPGDFLAADVLEGWEPAQLLEGEPQPVLQVNLRISEAQLLPSSSLLNLLQLALAGPDGCAASEQKVSDVLQHCLRQALQKYPAEAASPAEPQAPMTRHARAIRLVSDERRLLQMASEALKKGFGASPAPPEVSAPEAVRRLAGCAQELERLSASFDSLRNDGNLETSAGAALLSELAVLRACLASFPDG